MIYDNPVEIEQAKRLAAGPLGEHMSKFPLLFSKAAIIGKRPAKNMFSGINNGTVTLVNLGTGPMAITCAHVFSGYRELLQTTGRAIFQVGSVEIDPLPQLIAEDTRLDLAMVQLTEAQAKAIRGEGEIGSCFFQPVCWPSPPVKEGDFVAFGGFPGRWRERHAFDELVFSTFSNGACRVASVADDRFACQFEREYWVKSFDMDNRDDLRDLGVV